MNPRKWAVTAAAVVLAGGLMTGAAFAGGGVNLSEKLKAAVETGKLTQGQADVMQQLADLRKAQMEKLHADSKALIEQAVNDGKITQEQADKLLGRMGGMSMPGPGGKFGMKPHGMMIKLRRPMSIEELKARLEAAVKAGKLTQEQADEKLQHFTEMLEAK